MLGANLNPFKRKTDQPVAFWSGIVDAGRPSKHADWTVPDYFNGSLRIMAVAVNDAGIGTAETGRARARRPRTVAKRPA